MPIQARVIGNKWIAKLRRHEPFHTSNPARSVGIIEPDFYAAEVRAFGADGGRDAGADVAGRADVAGEFGLDGAELVEFVHGGFVDFFLSVEASAQGPFMGRMGGRTGFAQADGL